MTALHGEHKWLRGGRAASSGRPDMPRLITAIDRLRRCTGGLNACVPVLAYGKSIGGLAARITASIGTPEVTSSAHRCSCFDGEPFRQATVRERAGTQTDALPIGAVALVPAPSVKLAGAGHG